MSMKNKIWKNVLKWMLLILLIIIVWILYIIFFTRPRSVNLRTNDVARKSELSQIQTVIVIFQKDKWERPQLTQAVDGMSIRWIENELLTAWMSYVPWDPIHSNVVSWLWDKSITWEYMYMVSMMDWVPNWWFILMAKMDDELNSNWVVCDSGEWNIKPEIDLAGIKLCETVSKWNSCLNSNGVCTYTSKDQLRYILIY